MREFSQRVTLRMSLKQCCNAHPSFLYDSVKSLAPWSITRSESTLAQISMLLFWGRKESFHTGAASDLFKIACCQAMILQCVDPRRRLCYTGDDNRGICATQPDPRFDQVLCPCVNHKVDSENIGTCPLWGRFYVARSRINLKTQDKTYPVWLKAGVRQ